MTREPTIYTTQCSQCGDRTKKGSRLPGGAWICRKCGKARRRGKESPKR